MWWASQPSSSFGRNTHHQGLVVRPHLPTMAESELSPKFAPFIAMVSPSSPEIRGVRTDNGFLQAGIASAMIFGSTSTPSPVSREPTLDDRLDDRSRFFPITNDS